MVGALRGGDSALCMHHGAIAPKAGGACRGIGGSLPPEIQNAAFPGRWFRHLCRWPSTPPHRATEHLAAFSLGPPSTSRGPQLVPNPAASSWLGPAFWASLFVVVGAGFFVATLSPQGQSSRLAGNLARRFPVTSGVRRAYWRMQGHSSKTSGPVLPADSLASSVVRQPGRQKQGVMTAG